MFLYGLLLAQAAFPASPAVARPAHRATNGAKAKAANPICEKLTQQFDGNEVAFAFSHDLGAKLLKIEEDAAASIAPYEQQVAIAEARVRAAGGVPRPRIVTGPTSAEKVAASRAKIEADDAKFLAEGDRITTLLIANKCTPPDHVTTWYTYSERNPEGEANKTKLSAKASSTATR